MNLIPIPYPYPLMPFIHDNFLLGTPAAVRLYHEFAAEMPILDYHCHLPVRDIAEDRRFENLTQIWLAGDHYKWRAMRAAGVDERYITGDASDWEKFQAWADVVPKTLRNPLYHWTHLELARPFGIRDRLLGP
ncbi:MAG: glucuronate isomerase, partial [Planctomycetaceae bacterium]|nr:glucuronate isomerase [Planctomycetaceae bacterium]